MRANDFMEKLYVVMGAIAATLALVYVIDWSVTSSVYGSVADRAIADRLVDLLGKAIEAGTTRRSGTMISLLGPGYFTTTHRMFFREYAFNTLTHGSVRIPRNHLLHGMLNDLTRGGSQIGEAIDESLAAIDRRDA